MALDFPNTPADGDYDSTGQWKYNATKVAWQAVPLTQAKTVTSATAPLSPQNGDQWFNITDGTLYIYYTDANSSQWVESRAPITADGYISPNYVINGGFDIWQRGTSATNNTAHLADRWNVTANGTGLQCNQSKVAGPSTSIPNALRVQQVVAASSIIEYAARQPIERSVMQNLAGKTVTLSFWYRSNKTGVHSARLIGGAGTNVGGVDWNAAFTVPTADTWARYSITTATPFGTITGWGANPDTSVGAYIDIGFRTQSGSGSLGFTALSANDYFEITGVQLEEGTVATPFRRNANSIQGELASCKRYYQRYIGGVGCGLTGVANSGSTLIMNYSLNVDMRVTPATGGSGQIWISDQYVTDMSAASISVSNPPQGANTQGGRLVLGGFSSLVTGRYYSTPASASGSGYIEFNSEL